MKSSFYPKRTYYSDFVPIISSFKLFAESWVLQFNCDNIWNVEKCTCLGAANALLTLFLPLSRLSQLSLTHTLFDSLFLSVDDALALWGKTVFKKPIIFVKYATK